MYYVYILQNGQGKAYVGFSEDLKNRLKSHLYKTVKTTKADTYELVWYSAFKTKLLALAFERYLKHGSGHAFAKRHFLDLPIRKK